MSSAGAKKLDESVTVEQYTTGLTVKQHPLQEELHKETNAKAPLAMMMAAPEVLMFGQNFIRNFGMKRILDIGTFTGASALAWALAVPDDGKVYTLDVDHDDYDKYGVPIISKDKKIFKKIRPMEGPALQSLNKLISDGKSGTFDFAFIDADKASYCTYYDKALVLLRKGGVIFVDNSLWNGAVCHTRRHEEPSCGAIHAANKKIFADDRTYSALLNLGDGTHVAFKK